MRWFTLLAVLLVAGIVATEAQQAPAQGRGRGGGGQPVQAIQMIKPDLYVVPGAGANSIVRVTKDGVILVDTKLPGEANYNALTGFSLNPYDPRRDPRRSAPFRGPWDPTRRCGRPRPGYPRR